MSATSTMPVQIIIMAAGQGKRMFSRRPKVLHQLAGRPLLAHVLEVAASVKPRATAVVIGHQGEEVKAAFAERSDISFVEQNPPRGTGDAVKVALAALPEDGVTLVMNGDTPLIQPHTIKRLVELATQDRLALLTVVTQTPFGLGRIIRDSFGAVCAIVEERDATDLQREIKEINVGVLAAPTARLKQWVGQLKCANAQKEYYLTDILALAVAEGVAVEAVHADNEDDARGINDRAQLAAAERVIQQRTAAALLAAGVSLADPQRIDVRGKLHCGRDVQIDIGCVFEGEVRLGDNVAIGPYCVIADAELADGVVVQPYTHISKARVGSGAIIGPYARLRPGTVIDEEAHVGNFVELKATHLGQGSKANHLSYLGDADIGSNVNIGAGTITCNYDGANKYKTVIEDRVFVGSNTALIAPLTVGHDATIGAGSTLAEDVSADALTFTRTRPIVKTGWIKPKKEKAK